MSKKRLSRREFLRGAGLAGVGLALTAVGCQPKTVMVEKEVTTVVEKEKLKEFYRVMTKGTMKDMIYVLMSGEFGISTLAAMRKFLLPLTHRFMMKSLDF